MDHYPMLIGHSDTTCDSQIWRKDKKGKKRIRAGHKASTTKLLNKLDELRADSDSIDTSKLLRLKLSLEEKLGTFRTLDGEILDLTKDDFGDEADAYKEGIYYAMVEIEKLCAAARAPPRPLPGPRPLLRPRLPLNRVE